MSASTYIHISYLYVLLSKSVCVCLFAILLWSVFCLSYVTITIFFIYFLFLTLPFFFIFSFPPFFLSPPLPFIPINNFWRSTKGEAGEGEISTEQVINDLNSQCRAYCDSPDPYVTLNIGSVLTYCNAKFCGNLQYFLILCKLVFLY